MWDQGWRDKAWSGLGKPWDLIVVGGGITGAGILREAVRLGLRALLVDSHDFGWGTSSRSSKLVHGGLRYLKQGKLRLTRASVQERERLLGEGPGLIDPLGFLLATYKGDHPGRWTYSAGLSLYDLLALQWTHRHYNADDLVMLAPHIVRTGLEGGFRYGDAQTDDARLVLRVIREAVAAGGTAINYVTAQELLRDGTAPGAPVIGVRLRDRARGDREGNRDRMADVYGRVVVNATGAWADELREQVGGARRIRPLRGSHLVFPAWRLPVAQAVSFLHPVDRRPVFLFPWEGVTLVGTTDVDHAQGYLGHAQGYLGHAQGYLDHAQGYSGHAQGYSGHAGGDSGQALNEEPRIGPEEVAYLMAAVESQFPSLDLTVDDVVSTFAGVRPVIGTGKADPSAESRDHVVWQENGLLTVTGGKLTTFRLIALDVLDAVRHALPDLPALDRDVPVLDPVDVPLPRANGLDEAARRRLLGRYGADAPQVVNAAQTGELECIPGTNSLWVEVRWAARDEGVVHLDDLMLRRVRLGNLLVEGGKALLPAIRAIAAPELGWDEARWADEEASYLDLWHNYYSLPDREAIPDWDAMLAEAQAKREAAAESPRRKVVRRSAIGGALLALAAVVACAWWRWRRTAM